MPAELVGWGGPIPILIICLVLFWRRLTIVQRIVFVAIVYAISILTGILSNEVWNVGNYPSAVIAGVIAPIVYCVFFGVISQLLMKKDKAGAREASKPLVKPELVEPEQPAGKIPTTSDIVEPVFVASKVNQWNPIIVAAIIQAIASIIVALITVLAR